MHSWEEYAAWRLGLTDGAAEETKARHAFVCGDFRRLHVWPGAKLEKVRDGGRVVRKCLVIAHGVHESGRREVIGLDYGECETEALWRDFPARWSSAALPACSSSSPRRTKA